MTKKDHNEIQVVPKNNSSLLRLTNKEIEETAFTKSNCKLCTSKYRAELEQFYEDKRNMRSVVSELKNYGEEISYSAIRNHFIYHYLPQQKKLTIKEYASTIKELMQDQKDRREQLVERYAMTQDYYYDLSSIIPSLEREERFKNVEKIKILADLLSDIEEKIAEIDKAMEPVQVILGNLVAFFKERMQKASEETKRALNDILDDLANSTKNLLIEKKYIDISKNKGV